MAYDVCTECNGLNCHFKSIAKWCAKRAKHGVIYTVGAIARSSSLLDMITDVRLLLKASMANEEEEEDNHGLLLLSVALFVSILAPYVLAYSSGIKIFLSRKTFDSFVGLQKVLIVIYLLPLGVLYFLFVDCVDVVLACYSWALFSGGKQKEYIEETKALIASQLGLDVMSYEGLKRQRKIAQFYFEGLPLSSNDWVLHL